MLSALNSFGADSSFNVPPELEENLNKLVASDDPDTARYISLAHSTIKAAEKSHNTMVASRTYLLLILYLKTNISADRAYIGLNSLRRLAERHSEARNDFFTAWQNIIIQYYTESNPLRARDEFDKMHSMASKLNDNYGLACAYTALGSISEYSYETGIQNFNRALEHARLSGQHDKDFFIIYRMAELAYSNGKYEDVLRYANDLLALEEKPNNLESYAVYLNLITHLMLDNRVKSDSAFAVLNRQWETQTGIPPYFDNKYATALAAYHCKYGKPEKALELLPSIKDEKDKSQIEILYYKTQGDYRSAYEETKRYYLIEKRQMKANRMAEVGNATAYYNNKELEEKNMQLKMENTQTRNIMLAGALVFVLIAATYITITTRRHNRRLRAERAKAVHLNEMKSAFINSLTHEVRTPLNSIVGFNNMLNNSGTHFTEDERMQMLSQINTMTGQLTTLLDNVIFMSRIDANDITPSICRVAVAEVLAEAFAATADEAADGVSFDIEQALTTDLTVDADRELLMRSIKAVLENAVKFTPEGIIAITAEQCPSNPSKVQIAVTNPSPIIPVSAAEQIFERFEKLGSFKPGFGLGLSIAREILTLTGGCIELDTKHTEGNRFVITI